MLACGLEASLAILNLSITEKDADGDSDHHILKAFLASKFSTNGIYTRKYTSTDTLYRLVVEYRVALQNLVEIVGEFGGLQMFLEDPEDVVKNKMEQNALMRTLTDVYAHKQEYRARLRQWDKDVDALDSYEVDEISSLEDRVLDALVDAGYLTERNGNYAKVRTKPLKFAENNAAGVARLAERVRIVANGPTPPLVKEIKQTDDGLLKKSWVEELDVLPASTRAPRVSRFYLARDENNTWIYFHKSGRQFEVEGKYVGWSIYTGTWTNGQRKYMMIPTEPNDLTAKGWTLPHADQNIFKLSGNPDEPGNRRFVMRMIHDGVQTLYVLKQINRLAQSYMPEPDGVHVKWTPVGSID